MYSWMHMLIHACRVQWSVCGIILQVLFTLGFETGSPARLAEPVPPPHHWVYRHSSPLSMTGFLTLVPGIKLRSSCFPGKHFTNWAIFIALLALQFNEKKSSHNLKSSAAIQINVYESPVDLVKDRLSQNAGGERGVQDSEGNKHWVAELPAGLSTTLEMMKGRVPLPSLSPSQRGQESPELRTGFYLLKNTCFKRAQLVEK